MKRTDKLHGIQGLLYNPRTTIRDLAKAIAKDRALTEMLIKTIKSYGFPPEAWNITSAIILLGFGSIRSIVAEQATLRLDY